MIEAPLEKAQISMQLESELNFKGDVIPRITVKEVNFELSDQILISVFGDMPLYRTHEFEKAVEVWLRQSLDQREADFAAKLSLAER
jgi:hypothetical protein